MAKSYKMKYLLQASKMVSKTVLIIVVAGFAHSHKVCGVVPPNFNKATFPRPPTVINQVEFWKKIFLTYSSSSVVIHDVDYPNILIDIIDFQAYQKRYKLKKYPNNKKRDRITERYLKRYQEALARFHKQGINARKYGAIEERVWEVYSRRRSTKARLLSGAVALRSQTGLSDTFLDAAQKAQDFIPYMEETFEQYGVPKIITRVAFVESMFNVNAKSKVGASGLWQFMPQTAKKYLYVNHLVDERNSPLKSTRGAAMLLADNFKVLKSWPLAITAYNHGLYGMKRAIKQTGSRSIDKIIENYNGRIFGFASKNFYAEFLAAADSYRYLVAKGSIKTKSKTVDLKSIRLAKKISPSQLIRYTQLTKEMIEIYNPCIKETAFSRYKYQPLPPHFELFVPVHKYHRLRKSLASIKADRFAIGSIKGAR